MVHDYLAAMGYTDPARVQQEAANSDLSCLIRFYSGEFVLPDGPPPPLASSCHVHTCAAGGSVARLRLIDVPAEFVDILEPLCRRRRKPDPTEGSIPAAETRDVLRIWGWWAASSQRSDPFKALSARLLVRYKAHCGPLLTASPSA